GEGTSRRGAGVLRPVQVTGVHQQGDGPPHPDRPELLSNAVDARAAVADVGDEHARRTAAKGLEKVRLFVGHRPKAEHCAPRGEERIVRGVPSPVDLGVAKRVLLSVAGQGGTYSHGTVDL